MQFLAYIVSYPVIWFFSVLPFPLLYFFSDITYILLYKIGGYRIKTVRKNMAIALPHLSAKERLAVEKKFYRHFCDSFFEMAKTLTISEKELKKRFVFENVEVLKELELKNRSVALICAHYASYEWLLVMNKYLTTHKGVGIYKKIRNKHFDKLVRRIRGRFNAELVDTKSTIGYLRDNERKGILGYYGFISDQSPKIDRATYWTKFFGVEVPVHVGAEMLAKKFGMNILYVKGEKVKRGHYKATFIPMAENPKEIPNFEITDKFLRLLEKQILEAPEYYLWTHKRFKHIRTSTGPTA